MTHDALVLIFARIQFDNAPVTLFVVLAALAVEWAKHNIQGFRGFDDKSALFSTPARGEVGTLFHRRGTIYIGASKWRLPSNKLIRLVLFCMRVFLANVGHSGWEHFSNNASQLLLLGPACEGYFGSQEILIMIGVKSVVSVVAQWVSDRDRSSTGASGIVFMLYLLSAQVNRKEGKIPLTLLLQMAIYLPKELEPMLKPKADDKVSHIGHFAGAVVGAAFGFMYHQGTAIGNEVESVGRWW